MTILYEYIGGQGPCLWAAIVMWSIAFLVLVAMVVGLAITKDPACLFFLVVSCWLVLLGFLFMEDTRHPEVKALVDDNKNYEFIEQEGDIYTFEVKESVADE